MTTITTGIATSFITFSRTSNATVTASDGKIKWAGHNLLTNSESFDAASWSRQGLSGVTANAIAAPNGTTTADKLLENNLNDFHYVAQLNVIDDSAPVSTLSVYARAAERQYLNLALAWGANFVAATFDLTGGTVTSNRSGGTGASQSSSITSVGGGWYLCTLRGTIGTGGSDAAIIAISDSATPTGAYPQYTGTTGNGFHLWGAHLYRSDLGGMVANPARGDAYYSTTPRNLVGNSEDFTAATWSKQGNTLTANAIVAPNGLQTADLITETSADTNHSFSTSTAIAPAGTVTASVYAKNAGRYLVVALSCGGVGDTQFVSAVFDLANGTRTAFNATGSQTHVASGISSVGDGWYRVYVTGTLTAVANLNMSLSTATTAPTGNYGRATYTVSGTSLGIYLWGAQLSDSASLDAYSPVYGAAVTSAAYYAPRLDYDPVTLAAKGLLVEEGRTNLATYSNAFQSWIKTTGVTVPVADTIVSPDGTLSADAIVYDGTGTAGSYRFYNGTTAATVGVAYTCSIWMKAASNLTLKLHNNHNGVTTCNVTTAWQRFEVTSTPAGTGEMQLLVYSDTADNTAFTVHAWGGQIEVGSFSTSLIPTGSATATRTADVASVATSAFPYSASEGTIIAEAVVFGSGVRGILSLNDNSANNVFQIYKNGTANAYEVVSGGTTQANPAGATSSLGSIDKRAAVVKVNDFIQCVNGTLSLPDTTGALPAAATKMDLGTINADTSYRMNGWIRKVTYLPRRMTNAELQARTA